MEKIDRELLIKEISARLPYGVKAKVLAWDEEKGEVEVPLRIYSINTDGYVYFETNDYEVNYLHVDGCLLYLRPMSSMTRMELHEVQEMLGKDVEICDGFIDIVDSSRKRFTFLELQALFEWFLKNHFDFMGLIPKGLAIDCSNLDIY